MKTDQSVNFNLAESCTQCDFEEPSSDIDEMINENSLEDLNSLQNHDSFVRM